MFRDGKLVLRWNLDGNVAMEGSADARIRYRIVATGGATVKLRKVTVNARKRQLELTTRSGETLPFPFSRLDPRPSAKNPVVRAYVDPELAREGATYNLASGGEGVVLVDHALDYNRDPVYLTNLLVHRLTLDAADRMKKSGLSIREIARLLRTSVPQVYRLLDPANSSKSLSQLLSLLQALDCDVNVVVKPRRRRARPELRSQSRKAAEVVPPKSVPVPDFTAPRRTTAAR